MRSASSKRRSGLPMRTISSSTKHGERAGGSPLRDAGIRDDIAGVFAKWPLRICPMRADGKVRQLEARIVVRDALVSDCADDDYVASTKRGRCCACRASSKPG